MSAEEHLRRAIWLAEAADELFQAADDNRSWPDRMAGLEAARTAAQMAMARTAIYRELWLNEMDPALAEVPVRPVAPVHDLHSRTAPASPAQPAEAADQHPRKDQP